MTYNPDVIISLLIVLAVAFSAARARRDGRNNPVSTGMLQADLTGVKERLTKMELKVDEIVQDVSVLPTKADIESLKSDVRNVRDKIADHQKYVDKVVDLVKDAADRTESAVVRLEGFALSAKS